MKITADTNLLVRVLTGDDERQAAIAKVELAEAELVAITLPTLCELSWVLIRGYKHPAAEVSRAVRRLLDSETVAADRPAAEAGLAILDAGGDFADGVIAFEGRRLGADVLVSFDATAVQLVSTQGEASRLLS
ncbi:MAG: DNA-binding protein [Caulobacteraceae bacterium]|nr:DNA-binding protein [Caulobacteraceae bacterium]